jgi:hypothetical protein
MAKQSTIKFEILEDGTVSVTTEDLSGPNHHSADELLKQLADALGGEVVIKKRDKFHVHADLGAALHEHTKDGHVHTH